MISKILLCDYGNSVLKGLLASKLLLFSGCALVSQNSQVKPAPRFYADNSASEATDQVANLSSFKGTAVQSGNVLPSKVLSNMNWPLKEVYITSPFGLRKKKFHEGIDLRAPVGTPVYAAFGGIVIYATTRIRGYGKLVMVAHGDGVTTLYAHNSRLLVKKGQTVKKGQMIARSGKTGRCSGPHLHFELRKGLSSLDPELFLPQYAQASIATNETPVRNTLKRFKKQQRVVVPIKTKRIKTAHRSGSIRG